MATLLQICEDARILLGSPRAQKPSLRVLFKHTLRQTQNVYNRLSNQNKAWAVDEIALDVTANQDTYLLPVPATFGKPLLVYTTDPSNPSHVERAIEFFEIQNMDFNWELPNNSAAGWSDYQGSPTTAVRMAFYRNSAAAWYVRIKPAPMLPASYRLLFTVGAWTTNAAATSAPVLLEHHDLITTRVASRSLPESEWDDDEDYNDRKRKNLALTLTADEEQFNTQFEEYIANINHPRMGFRHAPSID